MPKFRKKYSPRKSVGKRRGEGSDARTYHEEKEGRGLRSSSSTYKDDIDSV